MVKVGYVLLLAVTACAGRSSSGGDGAEGASSSDLPPACVADTTVTAPASPVSGSVVGDRLRATLCSGGVTAFVEVTPGSATLGSQTVLIFDVRPSGDPKTNFTIQLPKQAVDANLIGLLGMTGPAPGTYSSESGCGSLAMCVTLPIPADFVCAGSEACPPGCALQGPVFGPTCQPTTPQVCYAATATRSCAGGTVLPHGSWSLTLTSVEAYAPDVSAALDKFVAHGTLTADVQNADDSTDSAQLSLAF